LNIMKLRLPISLAEVALKSGNLKIGAYLYLYIKIHI